MRPYSMWAKQQKIIFHYPVNASERSLYSTSASWVAGVWNDVWVGDLNVHFTQYIMKRASTAPEVLLCKTGRCWSQCKWWRSWWASRRGPCDFPPVCLLVQGRKEIVCDFLKIFLLRLTFDDKKYLHKPALGLLNTILPNRCASDASSAKREEQRSTTIKVWWTSQLEMPIWTALKTIDKRDRHRT